MDDAGFADSTRPTKSLPESSAYLSQAPHPIKQLRTLDLTFVKVTAEVVEELQQALPKCVIRR